MQYKEPVSIENKAAIPLCNVPKEVEYPLKNFTNTAIPHLTLGSAKEYSRISNLVSLVISFSFLFYIAFH